MQIAAELVARSVGLPLVWREPVHGRFFEGTEEASWSGLDLSDPQTAFGVALKLDAWERAGRRSRDGKPRWGGWAGEVAGYEEWGKVEGWPILEEMAAHLTHIGQDHAIRRALGWKVATGTLAVLLYESELDVWNVKAGNFWEEFSCVPDHLDFGGRAVPALAGITDPTEARAAIYEATRG